MYMSELGRWGVLDPHSESYEATSPYSYAFNNPMIFVDPTGMDNIIYLMVAGDMKKDDVNKIIDRANSMFKDMGLETTVQLFEGEFDAKNLDATDNWAVIGTDRKAIASKVGTIANSFYKNAVGTWAEKNDPTDPEVSDSHNNAMGIAVDHKNGNIGTHSTNSNPDATGGSALEIMHGAGHSGPLGPGTDYWGHQYSGVMMDGNNLIKDFRKGGASGIIQQDNARYVEVMVNRYGSGVAKDNYQRNQERRMAAAESAKMNAIGSGMGYQYTSGN